MSAEEANRGNLEVIQTAVANDDETCRTFVLKNETHTLGNAVRYMIMKNADVDFCGYSVPHPSENKINLRIQTKGEQATKVLKKGFTDLNQLCEHVLSVFEKEVETFKHEDIKMETD